MDRGLLLQLGLERGDTLRIGRRRLVVAGAVERIVGQPDLGAAVAPRVYLPLAALDTSLLGFGSRASYARHFRLPGPAPGDSADALVRRLEARLEALDIYTNTATEAEGDWAESL